MNSKLSLSPQMRAVAIGGVILVVVVLVVFKFALSGGNKAADQTVAPIQKAEATAAAATAAVNATTAKANAIAGPAPGVPVPVSGPAAATIRPAKPAPVVKKPAPIPALPTPKPVTALNPGLPPTVARALRRHETIVVSLMTPGSAVDEIAAREAAEGALRAGVAWVAVSVLNEADASALVQQLDVLQDPAVLIFRRPGNLVTELDGFADRDTVAQAATLAAK